MGKIFSTFFLFLLLQGVLSAQQNFLTAGYDWNNGGGNPQRNGLSSNNGPLTDSTLWEVNNGSLVAFPVYTEGNKLVTMKFLNMSNAPVQCFNLTTGELLWEKEITGLAGRSLPLGIREGQVYVMRFTESLYDTLYALNAENGDIIWRSNIVIDASITASVCFASNGDLFVEGYMKMYRINYLTGIKIWETNIIPFVLGFAEMSVYQNTGYLIEQIGGTAYLQAIDLNNGQKKYNHMLNDTHPGGPLQQCSPMVGPDGIIYAQKQGDNVSAFLDNGTSLSLLWESEIYGSAPFSMMCIGSDGSVYVPSGGKILRLDPSSGLKLDSTAMIGNPDLFQLRASASANEAVYATNGENKIYAFTLDLQELWNDNIPGVNTSGAAIGMNGLVAAAGSNMVKVYTPGPIVPVELISFTAGTKGSKVILNWSTASELNNIGFEVQRKITEGEFVTIGFVKGEGTSSSKKEYSFTDENLSSGKYFYRLKQNDYNGSYEYSDVIEIDLLRIDDYTLEQNYPNPFNPVTVIRYSVPHAKGGTPVQLKVYDIAGNEAAVLVNENKSGGNYTVTFDAQGLSSGTYFYKLQAGGFVEIRKMMLIK